ncbi:MAG: GNAT family N-acetyltransferase [Rhodospirillales bacterium]
MTPPAGTAPPVVTYLEMTKQPVTPTPPAPAAKLALLRAKRPTVGFYRFLYDAVGRRRWTERAVMDDRALIEIIHDDRVEIYVLYAAGVPAGFSELDRRRTPEIELVHFGLVREFTGLGFQAHFLRWTIDQAWTREPERLWVKTKSDDDPHMLSLYQQSGFVVYDQRAVAGDADDPGRPAPEADND